MAAIPGDRPKITTSEDLTKRVLDIHKQAPAEPDGGVLGMLSKLYLLSPMAKKKTITPTIPDEDTPQPKLNSGPE